MLFKSSHLNGNRSGLCCVWAFYRSILSLCVSVIGVNNDWIAGWLWVGGDNACSRRGMWVLVGRQLRASPASVSLWLSKQHWFLYTLFSHFETLHSFCARFEKNATVARNTTGSTIIVCCILNNGYMYLNTTHTCTLYVHALCFRPVLYFKDASAFSQPEEFVVWMRGCTICFKSML